MLQVARDNWGGGISPLTKTPIQSRGGASSPALMPWGACSLPTTSRSALPCCRQELGQLSKTSAWPSLVTWAWDINTTLAATGPLTQTWLPAAIWAQMSLWLQVAGSIGHTDQHDTKRQHGPQISTWCLMAVQTTYMNTDPSYSRTTDPDKAFSSSQGHNLIMTSLHLLVPQ